MTNQPFKFRHLDAIVGAFVIGAVAIVVAAAMLVGHARQWFTRHVTITAEEPRLDPKAVPDLERAEEMAEMLRPGTPIELGGRSVGQILEAHQSDGRLHLQMEVTGTALGQIRADAKAVIKLPLAAFMGQPRVVLKPGSKGDPVWSPDSETTPQLPIVVPLDSTQLAMSILQKVEANLQPMLARVGGVLDETQGLLQEIRAARLPERTGQLLDSVQAQRLPERSAELMQHAEHIATRAEQLLAGLGDGKGAAGRLLADEHLAADLAELAANLRAITGELRQATPGLAEGAGSLVEQAQRLIDGLSRHWLLKGYTAPPEPGRLAPNGVLPPAAPADPADPAEAKP